MSDESNSRLVQDRQLLNEARSKGTGAQIGAFIKLSGPGWLQSAITLGGGSLAGSLYLGIIGGYEMMWLQPLMMIFGVVMLSAIGYVALSTGERPFRSLNTHVNPVLGWGWAIATLMANLVWAMPQFSLGTAALRQNLGVLTFDGGDYVACFLLFAVAGTVIWFYDSGGKGIKIFEIVLKAMVGVVVLSFFAVVFAMTCSEEGLAWGSILAGFIPKPGLIFEPAESLRGLIEGSSAAVYWNETIISAQRDRMVAAAATAVGINMTFLLPYSMLKRGWDRDFIGLAVFDLATGLFIPFMLATSCIVIAAASQFHARPEPGLIQVHQPDSEIKVSAKLKSDFEAKLTRMLTETNQGFASLSAEKKTETMAALPEADRILAATLIERDAFALANSLEKLAGKGIAQYAFGIGVVGMAISTIIILMLINGFTICEILDKPSTGMLHRLGCYMPGVSGVIGALFLWSGKAKFYLAVPTSRFGMVLLPIAYIAFFCMMNNRKLLGDAMPKGGRRVVWNVLMGIGVILAMIGATISILNDKAQIPGTGIMVKHIALALVAALVVLALVIQFTRGPVNSGDSQNPGEA
ncbi:MAG: divalent metal cation transporter [Planctomycetota bacterium]|nr:divalent metal cation transporter [Planctomycetota bacterium]